MKKISRKKLIIVLLAVVVFGMLYISVNGLFAKKVEKEIVIPDGAGANSVVSMLKDERLIKSEFVMKMVIKLSGSSEKIRRGSVEISSKMSYGEILNKLKSANSNIKITIPEGYEIDSIVKLFEQKLKIPAREFYNEMATGKFDYEFVNGQLPVGKYRLEGYIYPETYYFDKSMTAHQVIDTCLAQFDKVYTAEMRKQTKKLGFTYHEMITLASIIEKEGKTDLEKISSVFHNRLKSDKFSYLESCATVIYVTKQPKDRLTYNDINVDSPYNTYINKGLPPGPIASPGEQAIKAAIYPADTEYFYFSAIEGGKNTFSKTYEEHLTKQE